MSGRYRGSPGSTSRGQWQVNTLQRSSTNSDGERLIPKLSSLLTRGSVDTIAG